MVTRPCNPSDLFWQKADGSEPAELLLNESPGLWPIAWSKDGTWLTFYRHQREAAQERPRAGRVHARTRAVEVIPTGPANRTSPPTTSGARLSPDQRWVASISDESGRFELYVWLPEVPFVVAART